MTFLSEKKDATTISPTQTTTILTKFCGKHFRQSTQQMSVNVILVCSNGIGSREMVFDQTNIPVWGKMSEVLRSWGNVWQTKYGHKHFLCIGFIWLSMEIKSYKYILVPRIITTVDDLKYFISVIKIAGKLFRIISPKSADTVQTWI